MHTIVILEPFAQKFVVEVTEIRRDIGLSPSVRLRHQKDNQESMSFS